MFCQIILHLNGRSGELAVVGGDAVLKWRAATRWAVGCSLKFERRDVAAGGLGGDILIQEVHRLACGQ